MENYWNGRLYFQETPRVSLNRKLHYTVNACPYSCQRRLWRHVGVGELVNIRWILFDLLITESTTPRRYLGSSTYLDCVVSGALRSFLRDQQQYQWFQGHSSEACRIEAIFVVALCFSLGSLHLCCLNNRHCNYLLFTIFDSVAVIVIY